MDGSGSGDCKVKSRRTQVALGPHQGYVTAVCAGLAKHAQTVPIDVPRVSMFPRALRVKRNPR